MIDPDKTDIAELFSRDPLGFTKENGEVRAIVTKLRTMRGQFNLGAMKAGNLKPKAPTKAAKAVAGVQLKGVSLNLQALLNKGASPQPKEEPKDE